MRTGGILSGAAITAVGVLLLVTTMRAQPTLEAGLSIGYENGSPLGLNRTPGAINTTVGFDGRGTSANHLFWLGGDVLLPQLFSSNIGLHASLGLASSHGMFTSLPYDVVDPTLSPSRHRFLVDISEDLFRLGLGLPISFGAVSLEPGLWTSYRMTSSVALTDETLDITGVTTGSSVTAINGGLTNEPLHYGAAVTGAVRIPLSDGITLQPSVTARVDLPALQEGQGSRSFSLGAGASLLVDIGSIRQAHQEMPPSVMLPNAPDTSNRFGGPTPVLTASVQLYSNSEGVRNADAVTVHAEDVVHRLRMPLLPVLYFGDGITALPARYQRLRRSDAATFSPASLGGMEPADIYYATLDIVGWRMRRDPTARITLTGTVAADEPKNHGMVRARNVAAYLRDVWQIDEGRVTLQTTRSSERRGLATSTVHLASSSPSITAPVATQWIVRSFVAPVIGATPTIHAEAGVSSWTITIAQNGRQVAHYGSGDTSRPVSSGMILPSAPDAGQPSPLIATLTIVDSTGQQITVRDTLPVLPDKRTLQAGLTSSHERLRVLFMGEEGEASSPGANQMLLQSLGAYVRDGARVTILPNGTSIGHADSTGIITRDLVAELGTRGARLAELHVDTTAESNRTPVPDASVNALFSSAIMVVVEQETNGPQTRGE